MEFVFYTYMASVMVFILFVVYRFIRFVIGEDFSADRYQYEIRDGTETVIDKTDN